MVIDRLENFSHYIGIHSLFPFIAEFISKHSLRDFAVGRHTLIEEKVYLIIEEVQGKAKETATLESHQKMIDIQIPLEVTETFGYSPTLQLPTSDYCLEKDITFYRTETPQTYVTCPPGMFVVFFPQDAHAPCIAIDSTFKKAIFKIKASM